MASPLPKRGRSGRKSMWLWLSWLLPCVVAIIFLIGPPPQGFGESTPTNQKPGRIYSQIVPTSLIAFGDFGSGMAGQMRLAKQMVSFHQQHPFTHALLLGDNLYPDGDVKHWGESRFTVPYQPLIDRGISFITALGNHDVLFGFEKDQIAFFKMPSAYYDRVVGPIHIFVLNTNRFNTAQSQWLEGRLKASTARYKIVMGHHPVKSSGEHGPTNILVKSLKPLLEKYHVQLYLCGHDHDYERFTVDNGVTYIVSGGGGASLRPFEKPQPGSLVRKSVYEFVSITPTDKGLAFQAIQDDGTVIDQGLIP